MRGLCLLFLRIFITRALGTDYFDQDGFQLLQTEETETDNSSEDDSSSQQDENTRVLDLLVNQGVNVNAKDFYGLTALHHASLRGNLACVKRLLACSGIAIEVGINDTVSYLNTPTR